jgi:hypothetical protein
MGGHGARAKEELDRREEMERTAWLAHEEVGRTEGFGWGGGAFAAAAGFHVGGGYHMRYEHEIRFGPYNIPIPPGISARIPARHRPATDSQYQNRHRPLPAEFPIHGGHAPEMGHLNDAEYAEWIRQGMYRRKHRAETEAKERAQRKRMEEEHLAAIEKERKLKEEKKRMAQIRAEKSVATEAGFKEYRIRYRTRWKAIGEVGGEIEESELAFADVPWPVYQKPRANAGAGTHYDIVIGDLQKENIKKFLMDIAADDGAKDNGKAILREAIRVFHPDKFYGKMLDRVRALDRDKVKEGVEICSRVINILAGELKSS